MIRHRQTPQAWVDEDKLLTAVKTQVVLVSVREKAEKSNEMSTGPHKKKYPNYQTDILGSRVSQFAEKAPETGKGF